MRRRAGSSSESTSSRSSERRLAERARRSPPPRRAGARARRAAARPASRSCAGRAAPETIATSSRCGPSPVAPRSMSRSSRASSAVGGRRLAVVDERARPGGRARRPARRSRARAARSPRVRASTSSRAELGDLLRPRRQRVARREPRRDAAQPRVALPDRRAVLERQPRRGPGARRPSVRSKYARRTAGPPLTTASRSGVKTSVDDLGAQLLGRAQPAAVHRRALAARRATASPRAGAATSPRRPCTHHACGGRAEADELRVGPGPRREALRADVQRLEQVRLPGAVRPGHEHEARLEVELEPRVGAEVPERDPRDDQPARRIGMIRYLKSSPAAWIRPGRSGLISFSGDLVLAHRLEPVAEELGVEADLERLAGVGDRQGLARLADVLASAPRRSARPRRSGVAAESSARRSRRRGGRRRGARRAAASARSRRSRG